MVENESRFNSVTLHGGYEGHKLKHMSIPIPLLHQYNIITITHSEQLIQAHNITTGFL